ncbi:uncharacterized protein LOC135485329 [Lineus longissimus]|uniref:uncharacterized protein LOC135485329 n=1 Tax=Lineus longissimus TaxID=88925 RepID=UPI002B4C7495
MASNQPLSDDLGVPASLEKLKKQFDAFYSYRTVLKESYGRVSASFQLLEGDEVCDSLKNVFTEGTNAIDGVLEKNPVIMIGGQLNCGKSSFINLLLNRRVVPVNQHPCTARIVRIKYSQEEYFQLTDATGNTKGPKCPLDRKTLRKEIQLEGERESRAKVDEMVEIGLNSPLLESGLQIIDTPGLSENEALDAVVTQCLDGVLQVLFYVIDGNTAWRRQDAEFMSKILKRSPDIKIIYVCNKCEEDEEATMLDAPDSDSETETLPPPIPKGTIVFSKLKNSCLLSEEEEITCNRFFQISCTRLKRSQSHDYKPDEFSIEYQRLTNSLCVILRHFLYHFLRQAALKLFGVVTKCYDVCSKHERSRPDDLVPLLLEKFEETHLDFVTTIFKYEEQLMCAVAGVMASKIDDVSNESITRLKGLGSILQMISKKGFYPLLVCLSTLGEKIASDETMQLTLKTMDSELKAISKDFFHICEELGARGDILTLLKGFTHAVEKADIIKGLPGLIRQCLWKLVLPVMDVSDVEETAELFLPIDQIVAMVDPGELSQSICRKISNELSDGSAVIYLVCKITESVEEIEKGSQFSKEVRYCFPAENMILKSLLSTLKYKEITILETVGEGRHCMVYKAKQGNMILAARRTLEGENSEDFRDMAKTYAMFRDLNDHLNILKSLDVGRAPTGQVLLLVPYIEKSLYQELCDGTMLQCEPDERLSVGIQIVKGCMYLKEMGLEAVDLRPNNIRLQDGCPKIDISKWRGVSTPYPPPDNQLPFHFPAECICADQKRYPSTLDSYGSAILIWMLACGKFIRPPFASEEGSEGQGGPDPTVAILCNLDRVRQEFDEIIQQCSGAEAGMSLFLPLVRTILEKCITDEMERMDVFELHEMLQSQMAILQ